MTDLMARLSAAEAEIVRLREALGQIAELDQLPGLFVGEWHDGPCAEIARAALRAALSDDATPTLNRRT